MPASVFHRFKSEQKREAVVQKVSNESRVFFKSFFWPVKEETLIKYNYRNITMLLLEKKWLYQLFKETSEKWASMYFVFNAKAQG